MTLQNKVKEYLEYQPQARERKNRSRAVWNILTKKMYPQRNIESVSKELFDEYFVDIMSINRYILWVQQHYPELRGSDYEDKTNLEQKKKLELGYEPGHYQRSKKLQRSI